MTRVTASEKVSNSVVMGTAAIAPYTGHAWAGRLMQAQFPQAQLKEAQLTQAIAGL
jgi:hypothetical protein